jgi:ElaB/YqjD/DUF883 family membrane-anchored ribosome-binding protein
MNSNPEFMTSMDDTMQAAHETTRRTGRRVGTEVRNLIADVEELIRRVAHLEDADLAQARERLERTLQATRASLHNGSERVRATARQAANNTDTYVHENPWSAIGIAAAAGAAIAVLLSTRLTR